MIGLRFDAGRHQLFSHRFDLASRLAIHNSRIIGAIFDKRQNRITESKSELVKISDVIEYNEFDGKYQDNLNSLFRNRPNGSFVIGEGAWRNLFSARNRFMSYEELKQQAFEKNKSMMSSIINRLP